MDGKGGEVQKGGLEPGNESRDSKLSENTSDKRSKVAKTKGALGTVARVAGGLGLAAGSAIGGYKAVESYDQGEGQGNARERHGYVFGDYGESESAISNLEDARNSLRYIHEKKEIFPDPDRALSELDEAAEDFKKVPKHEGENVNIEEIRRQITELVNSGADLTSDETFKPIRHELSDIENRVRDSVGAAIKDEAKAANRLYIFKWFQTLPTLLASAAGVLAGLAIAGRNKTHKDLGVDGGGVKTIEGGKDGDEPSKIPPIQKELGTDNKKG